MNLTGIKARVLRRSSLALCVALAALSGCGGGSRKVDFHPGRVVAFGDESSMLVAGSTSTNATKYSINYYNTALTTPGIDCTAYPIWVQYLAGTLGLSFTTCPGTLTGAAASSVSLATARNTAGGVVADLDTYLTAGANGQPKADHDLVTVWVGQQDVLDRYAALPPSPTTADVDVQVGLIQDSALALAQKINQVAQSGPPVIVVTIPNVSLTPFGRTEESNTPGRGAILTRLSQAYNDKLTLSLVNDGHLIGLVNGETEVQNMSSTSQSGDTNGYGIAKNNVGVAACSAPATASLTSCIYDNTTASSSTNTLVAVNNVTQSAATYLWAGDTQLGPVAHARLGLIAESRAKNNPF